MIIKSPGNFLFFYILIMIIIIQILVVDSSYCMGVTKEPTAIVMDDETGEPIEGAVAIAIWREHSIKEAAWFEGGTMVPVRVEEVVSDKEGKIYIDGFWGWHFFENKYPRLTIYKQGYVCWDQKIIYINEFESEKREDFNKEKRIIRMKKWPEGFSFNGHRHFMDSVTEGDSDEAPEKLFNKAFDYERSYRIKESTRINLERKEMNKRGGRND